jgi:regulator of protease activity HflC (stomatin/prohibitin superfamily)
VVLRIPGQEVILGDHTSLKTNITGVYRIAKPAILLQKIARTDLQEHITQLIQLRVREVLSSKSLDELMEKREAASLELDEKIKREFADIGLELIDMKIKDIILPAELRNAYIEAFSARLRSQAQLEQARGQSAALRNLANTADLLEKHPQLLQLMSLQKKDSNLNLHFDQVTTKK